MPHNPAIDEARVTRAENRVRNPAPSGPVPPGTGTPIVDQNPKSTLDQVIEGIGGVVTTLAQVHPFTRGITQGLEIGPFAPDPREEQLKFLKLKQARLSNFSAVSKSIGDFSSQLKSTPIPDRQATFDAEIRRAAEVLGPEGLESFRIAGQSMVDKGDSQVKALGELSQLVQDQPELADLLGVYLEFGDLEGAMKIADIFGQGLSSKAKGEQATAEAVKRQAAVLPGEIEKAKETSKAKFDQELERDRAKTKIILDRESKSLKQADKLKKEFSRNQIGTVPAGHTLSEDDKGNLKVERIPGKIKNATFFKDKRTKRDSLDRYQEALLQYRRLLEQFGPEILPVALGGKGHLVGGAHNNMIIEIKEAAKLGALQEHEKELVTNMILDPIALKNQLLSGKDLLEQLDLVESRMMMSRQRHLSEFDVPVSEWTIEDIEFKIKLDEQAADRATSAGLKRTGR